MRDLSDVITEDALPHSSSPVTSTLIGASTTVYVCDFHGCNKAFAQSGNLATHKRIHSAEARFPCTADGCDSKFKRKHHLDEHTFYWHTAEGQARKKKEESRIVRLLEANGVHHKPQHTIDFTCIGKDREGARSYIDFLIECKDAAGKTTGFILLEVDEHQHEWYDLSCELRRMMDAHRSLILGGNSFPIMFLRYNPHAFCVDGVPRRVLLRDREAALLNCIQNAHFDQSFSVAYMFYDVLDGAPAIFSDPAYDTAVKSLVIDCVH